MLHSNIFTKKLNKKSKNQVCSYNEFYLKNSLEKEEDWAYYHEAKKQIADKFIYDTDPVNVLFKFYGLILLITAFIALMIFIAVLVFGKIPIFMSFPIIVVSILWFLY